MKLVERVALAATALVAAAAIAACGDDSSSGSGGGGGDAGVDKDAIVAFEPGDQVVTEVKPTQFRPKPLDGDCTIAFLPPYNIEFFQAVGYGTVTEAKRLGCEVTFQAGQGYGDPTTQLKAFDTALAQGVDGIIIGPVNEQALAPSVDRAWAEGVPVVYSEIVSPSEKKLAILTDNELVGRAQAEYVAKKDPKAQVISFCGPPGLEWGQQRCDAFKQSLAELAPDAKVVAEKFHPMERSAIANIAGNTLEAFPDAGWVFNSTDVQSTAVVDALRSKGMKPGDVKVTTLGSTRESVKLLEEGWQEFALAERGVLVGELGVRMLVSVLQGDDLDGAWAWAPELPPFTAGSDVAEEFCGGVCKSPWKGEAKYNFAPDGFAL
jgi:ABC-type sugar transport system substrate-binding protein